MQLRATIKDTDLKTILLRLDNREQNIVALKSVTDNGWGNILAWNPVAIIQYSAASMVKNISELEAFTDEQQALNRHVIGYLSYDFGCQIHNIELNTLDDLQIPKLFVAAFDNFITFSDAGAEINTSNEKYIDEVRAIINRPIRDQSKKVYEKELTTTLSRRDYGTAFKKLKKYIQAGDVYQVNLTHRLEGTTKLSGQELFCTLSEPSEADFQAYISNKNFEVLSFSPERFVSIKDHDIKTSPIKGTRPRGLNKDEDKALKKDLIDNSKDKAELNMITDLMRNDLGAICEVGSVKITDNRVISGYPTLWHTHTTIEGRLVPEMRPIIALANLMPGGSITGCPKKSAIEIIDELEEKRRNIYTGSIFMINPDGELDSNVAIRTILKKSDQIFLSVGGGIVNDSDENEEYKESLDKAASFMMLVNKNKYLSSDILEKQFGPTNIEILYQDQLSRISCTRSTKSGRALELSQVTFNADGVNQFSNVHKDIANGMSIGKAFRAEKIEFMRETQSTFKCDLPFNFSKWFDVTDNAIVVNVSIIVGSEKILYANIVETYISGVKWSDSYELPSKKLPQSVQNFNRLLGTI